MAKRPQQNRRRPAAQQARRSRNRQRADVLPPNNPFGTTVDFRPGVANTYRYPVWFGLGILTQQLAADLSQMTRFNRPRQEGLVRRFRRLSEEQLMLPLSVVLVYIAELNRWVLADGQHRVENYATSGLLARIDVAVVLVRVANWAEYYDVFMAIDHANKPRNISDDCAVIAMHLGLPSQEKIWHFVARAIAYSVWGGRDERHSIRERAELLGVERDLAMAMYNLFYVSSRPGDPQIRGKLYRKGVMAAFATAWRQDAARATTFFDHMLRDYQADGVESRLACACRAMMLQTTVPGGKDRRVTTPVYANAGTLCLYDTVLEYWRHYCDDDHAFVLRQPLHLEDVPMRR